ncbi:MAG: tetratricopeptide repeat protein [Anaerolineales bacterium]|nr:tetratricopeptide repeat protein [Anaerolineales bacterium]
MEQQPTFAELLQQHVAQDGRYARQLAKATAVRFGQEYGVSHSTISRWLRGAAQKPRSWIDIVKLGAVLQLSQDALLQLLQVAGHDAPEILETDPPIVGLFDLWRGSEFKKLPPFQVPPKTAGFVGQSGFLDGVARYLCSQVQSRVCCLLGMAGLGKTSLAAQLAYHLREHFVDGVLWVDLAQTEPLAAQQAIAKVYGEDFSIYPDLGTRSSKLRDLLSSKNALVILDHAQDDAQIRPLLPPDSQCAILVTSRRYNLASTGTAYRLTVPLLDPAESLTLFQHILDKKTIRAEAQPLQQIASLLGHLPLALHIVAQRLKHEPGWSVAGMLARLQQAKRPLDLLVWGDQSVRRQFAASYASLPLAEQTLFASLGCFSGSFLPEHVAVVVERPLSEVEDGLRQLYTHSLLTITRQNRYVLAPLWHLFSQEQPQQAAWPHRFVAHFSGLAGQTEAVAEQQNIIAAIDLAEQLEMDAVMITAVTELAPHLQRTGQHEQTTNLLKRAERVARRQKNSAGLARILHQLGFTAMKEGVPEAADSYYQEALTLAQKIGDAGQTAEILLKLSALSYRRGRYEETEQFCQEALVLARQVGNESLMVSLLGNLGLVEKANGRFDKAISHYEEALRLARQLDDQGLIINILQNLGLVHEKRGDYAQARTNYEEGLARAEKQKDPELRSRMLGNLGSVACHLGNYAEATGYFRQGLSLAEASGLTIQRYRQLANLGEAAMLRGQFRQAKAHYREALALVRACDFPEDLGIILNQAGENFLKQDAYAEATTCFNESLSLANEKELKQVGPLSLFGLARVAGVRGNIVEARQLGEQSREQLLVIGHRKAEEVWWWLQELPRTSAPE